MAMCIDDRVSTQTAQTAGEPASSGAGVLFVDFQAADLSATGNAGGDQTLKLTAGPAELLDRIIRSHQGQTMKAVGESFLAEFPDSVSAVRAALEIQQLQGATEGHGSAAGVRIGVHLAGQASMLEEFGRAVHVAAGITKHAASGQVLVSREIQQAISTESDFTCRPSHTVCLDEGCAPIDLYEVQRTEMTDSIPSRYEVLSRVGTGGMGIVYKVLDREINDIVALKVLKAGVADDPAMQENFRREVSLARKVTHKNVCRIYEFNRSESMAYVSMEFIEGESLLAKLRHGPLSWEEAQSVTRQICSGLREAHAQGIVHRDLKPANIMVDSVGTVKITDFGIARVFQGTGQMTGTLVGTPAYMAPEQVELKRIDERTDIYALGLLLYEIVTAMRAFPGDTPIAVAVKQLREFPKRPRMIVPALPAHAEAIILKCLHKDPAKRFQSVDELALALGKPAQTQRAPAASTWPPLAAHARRLGRQMDRQSRSGAAAIARLIKRADGREDWRRIQRFFTTTHARITLASLGGLCLVTASLALATHLHSSKRSPAASSANAPAVHNVVFAAASAGETPSGGASRSMADYSVDLAYSRVGSQKVNASLSNSKPAPKPAARSLTSVPKSSAPKAQPLEPTTVASRPAAAVATPANVPTLEAAAQPAPAKIAPADVPAPTAAPSSASEAAPVASVIDPPKEKQGDAAKEDSSQTARYFSVGNFKESMWADEAVGKLVQLGFPAISVHKKALWIQSYEVRVGPYENAQDLEAASKQLRDFGFKPHPVK